MKLNKYARSGGKFVPASSAEELPEYVATERHQEVPHAYGKTDEVSRSCINFTVTKLCGHTLPDLVRLARGEQPRQVGK